MKRIAILFLGLVAALATNAPGQSSKYLDQKAQYVATNDGVISRPRMVAAMGAGVKASVITNTASVERIAFDMINDKRAENGLTPLIWSDEIAAIARLHSRNMAELNFFSHRGKDDSMVSDRADRSGLKQWSAIGENIAFNRGYKDPVEVAVKLWIGSTSHRHNLLSSNWRESAVGVAVAADGSYYFTQVFLAMK